MNSEFALEEAQASVPYDHVGHMIMLVGSVLALALWCAAGFLIIQGIFAGP